MEVIEKTLPGVLEIQLDRYLDGRGFFSEIFNPSLLARCGIKEFAQGNLSESQQGVFRGFHFQVQPFQQGKLVYCMSGSITDYVLDPDSNSLHFGQVVSIDLSPEKNNAVWIPGNYAHGFLSHEDKTQIFYLVTKPWEKDYERTIRATSIGIPELSGLSEQKLSSKDFLAPTLEQVQPEPTS